MLAKLLLCFALLAAKATATLAADAPPRKILFFSKSSDFEHSVISWKGGKPSFVEKTLSELGVKHNWQFTFSKDGSLFGKAYLSQFDAVFFYTTGDLTTQGTDSEPPLSVSGKQALFDYVRSGRGFIGTHSASDTFHTKVGAGKNTGRWVNHGDQADDYVKFLGGEFVQHGAQQMAKNIVIDPRFPGFEKAGTDFSLTEEWYSLKEFAPDLHVLTVIDAPAMKGSEYKRAPYPTTWARPEGAGRVWFSALGHREDVWTNPLFQSILVGGIQWAMGDTPADITPNLKAAAPMASINPLSPELQPVH